MQPQLSIVIPAFNEEPCIDLFFSRLQSVLNRIPVSYEVIFVDDGSEDGTAEVINALTDQHIEVRGVIFSRNFGKEAAIHAGLSEAAGAAVVVIDADGQHPVELIPEMVRHWQNEGALIVSAVKRDRGSNTWATLQANLFYAFFKRIAKIDLKGDSDFKLLDRKVVDVLLGMPERARFFRGLTRWMGFNHINLQFDVKERLAGTSKWSFIELATYALNAIIAFSSAPLIVIVYFGFIGVFCSIILAIVALLLKFYGTVMTGWTSLIIVVSFFGSMILTSIGFLGLYMMKVYDEIKGRHHYVISRKILPASIRPEVGE